jgi:hypothetical protein
MILASRTRSALLSCRLPAVFPSIGQHPAFAPPPRQAYPPVQRTDPRQPRPHHHRHQPHRPAQSTAALGGGAARRAAGRAHGSMPYNAFLAGAGAGRVMRLRLCWVWLQRRLWSQTRNQAFPTRWSAASSPRTRSRSKRSLQRAEVLHRPLVLKQARQLNDRWPVPADKRLGAAPDRLEVAIR